MQENHMIVHTQNLMTYSPFKDRRANGSADAAVSFEGVEIEMKWSYRVHFKKNSWLTTNYKTKYDHFDPPADNLRIGHSNTATFTRVQFILYDRLSFTYNPGKIDGIDTVSFSYFVEKITKTQIWYKTILWLFKVFHTFWWNCWMLSSFFLLIKSKKKLG